MSTLFPDDSPAPAPTHAPLAERMRPRRLEEVVGQEHLLGEGRFLSRLLESGELPSLIFWGPPGVGKTTLAEILARRLDYLFVPISAVLSGVKEVKKVIEEAEQHLARGRRTLLFVDEIHRFNKAQQDAFLPHVEKGSVTLIGATTENPSFEVIGPLLSRTRVLTLKGLEEDELVRILERALQDEARGLGALSAEAGVDSLRMIAAFADGDARRALNGLEVAALMATERDPSRPRLDTELVREALQTRTLLYDRAGEEHFNLISALHKSLRNSDVDASLYWLGRMLEAGEDPLYIARRLVRFASEDVGLAAPQALNQTLAAMQAVDFLGLPEGKLALAQAAVYLAQAPKSNALYRAYDKVQRDIETTRNEPVPLHLRNAPTGLMRQLGYGKGYRYAHEEPDQVAAMECLPEPLQGRVYYQPSQQGFEKEIEQRLQQLRRLRTRKT